MGQWGSRFGLEFGIIVGSYNTGDLWAPLGGVYALLQGRASRQGEGAGVSPDPRWLGGGSLTASITDLFQFSKILLT